MNKRLILATIIAFGMSVCAFAQTSLQKGDLVFLSINSDGDDEFSFFLLKNIEAGTEINFTDRGVRGNGAVRPGEGTLSWTAVSALACGTEVIINPGQLTASSGTVTAAGTFDIDPAGDQIIAFQGSIVSQPAFKAAIHTNGGWETDAIDENTSAIPTGLTDGTHCVAPNVTAGTAFNSAIINCDILFGPAAIRNYVNGGGNFTINSTPGTAGPSPGCNDFNCELDTEEPTFTDCPSDIAQARDNGVCGANVSWTEPTFSDNSGQVNVTKTHSPGDFFSAGTTRVSYVGEDPSGNVDSCVFFVTIEVDNYAGEDGFYETCRNGSPFNLSDQLQGTNIASGGTWYDPNLAVTTDNQDPNTMIAGFYKYVVSSSVGCPDDSALVEVDLSYKPAKPTVTPSGLVNACDGDQVQLVSSSLFNNQWYKDGLLLLGEVNQDLVITSDGDYWVRVTEDGCASVNSDTARVRFNPIVTIDSIDASKVSCNDGNSGRIEIFATGGTPVLKYSIDGGITFQTSNVFNNLPPNTYQVIVKGSKGCSDEAIASTFDNDGIDITAALLQNITCNNEADGVIEGTATGGSGNYFYTLHNAAGPLQVQGNGTFTGLTEDTYFIAVEDITTGCKDTSAIIVIDNPDILEIDSRLVNGITCFNDNNAFITASATGGTKPYSFALNFTNNYGPSGNFQNLSGGLYIVIVKDAFGCTDTSDVYEIQNPLPIVLDSTEKENVTCFGLNDGVIRVFAQGGSGLQYSIDNTTFIANGEFTGLGPGTYPITIRDNSGCQLVSTPITISEPARINGSASVVSHVSCFAGDDGAIQAGGSGGVGNLVYGISTQPGFQGSPLFDELRADSYDIYIMDTKGCVDTIFDVTVHQPQRFSVIIDVDSTILCHGDSNGIFTVSATGGRGAIEYSLDGINYSGQLVYDSLKGGNYTVRARDSAGCIATAAINVPEPDELTADLSPFDITCAGANDGRIRVNVTGGTLPYSFSIDSGLTFQNNANFYGLSEGTYGFLVVDHNGCSVTTDSVFIENPDTLEATVTVNKNLSCFRSDDGKFSVSVQGGRKPYQFSIDGLSYLPDSVFTNLATGNYQVRVLDSSGCLITLDPVFISQPPRLKVDTAVATHISCFGQVDGEIVVVGSGGIPGLYEFSVDGINYQFDNRFDSLFPGTYDVFIRDSSGCISQPYEVEIIEPAELEGEAFIVNHVTCNGLRDGSITVEGLGGTGDYQYSINNGNSWQQDSVFTGLGGGNYTVLIKDENDCIAVTNSVVIVNPPLLSIVATLQEPISCRNANDAIISVQAFGGTGTYTFSIDGTNYATNSVYQNLSPGTYTLYVKDQNGCVSIAPNIVVTNPASLNMTLSLLQDVSCPGGSDGRVQVNATGGTGVKVYRKGSGNFQQSNVFNNLSSGVHTFFVKDENGCEVSQTINLSQPVPFIVTHTIKDEIAGNDGEINIEVNNVITPVTYKWAHGPITEDLIGLSAASYTVTITDGKGCTQTHTYTVKSRIGLEELDPASIVLYPNPTNGLIQLELEGTWTSYEYDLMVLNNLGQVVHSQKMFRNGSKKQVDLSHLANGHYYLSIIGEEGTVQKAFIKH